MKILRIFFLNFIDFKLGGVLLSLLFFLAILYPLNIILASLGYNYSSIYQLGYLFLVFFGIILHFIYVIPFDRTLVIFFLCFSCISLVGILLNLILSMPIPWDIPTLFIFNAILLPLIVVNVHLQGVKNDFIKTFNLFIIYIIFKTSLYLIFAPFELSHSMGGGFNGLQFTGGQYHNIGILLITLSCAHYFRIKTSLIFVLNLLLFLTLILSFSRVGSIICIFLVVYYALPFLYHIVIKISFKKVLFLLTSLLVFWLLGQIQSENIYINDFLNYWSLRLNQVNGEFDVNNIFDESYADNARILMLDLIFQKSNFIYILFGSGIGTSQFVLSYFTSGELQFGSFHNIFGTVLVERGLFVLIFLVYFLFYIARKILFNSKAILFFMLFILLSISTGVELFVNARDLNFDVTIILFLYFSLIRVMNLQSFR
jgi:hypothetical protein